MHAPNKSDVIRVSAPRVTRRLLSGSDVRGPIKEGLDLTLGDHAIINHALVLKSNGADTLLLTDNNIAAMTAEEFGLSAMFLPENWLKDPEPDDSAKEMAKRDAEISRLKAAEPVLELRFFDARDKPINRLVAKIPRYLPVPPSEVERLMRHVAELAPAAEVQPAMVGRSLQTLKSPPTELSGLDRLIFESSHALRPVTTADIKKYHEDHAAWLQSVRRRIVEFHSELNRRREWPLASLLAQNTGTRPAQDVLVEIEANGNFEVGGTDKSEQFISKSSWVELQMPPTVPKVRPYENPAFDHTHLYNDALSEKMDVARQLLHSPPRSDDSFYWRNGRINPVAIMALECKTWRHARPKEAFGFRIWADDTVPVSGLIVGRVSAGNLSRAAEARLPVRIGFEDNSSVQLAEQLVDDLERRLVRRSQPNRQFAPFKGSH
jgi:hypothetical protein